MKRSIHKVVLVYKPISNFKFSGGGVQKRGLHTYFGSRPATRFFCEAEVNQQKINAFDSTIFFFFLMYV